MPARRSAANPLLLSIDGTDRRTYARPLGIQGGNVTSAGWQVTLCDPMWHVSSRSGVATLRTAIHLLLTNLLTYIDPAPLRILCGQRQKHILHMVDAVHREQAAATEYELLKLCWSRVGYVSVKKLSDSKFQSARGCIHIRCLTHSVIRAHQSVSTGAGSTSIDCTWSRPPVDGMPAPSLARVVCCGYGSM